MLQKPGSDDPVLRLSPRMRPKSAGGFLPAARLLLWYFLGLLAVAADAALAEPVKRVEVPISQHRLSNGEIRYSVPVVLGGERSLDAMLDTGSFGLRVLSRVIAPASYTSLNIERRLGFASGVEFRGTLVRMKFSIGNVPLSPLVVQLVTSVGCVPSKPGCPAAQMAPTDYRIGGDGLAREGYWAIIGMSMAAPRITPVAANPLLAIADQRWVVTLPLPGQAGPGTLIINPTNADLAGFGYFPLDTLFSRQSSVAADLGEGSGAFCPEESSFRRDSCLASHLDTGSRKSLNMFYRHAVLFDYSRRMVGLGPRR